MNGFVDRETRRETTANKKEEDIVRSKLLKKTYGQLEDIEPNDANITINEQGITKTVSIERVAKVAHSPGRTDPKENPRKSIQIFRVCIGKNRRSSWRAIMHAKLPSTMVRIQPK